MPFKDPIVAGINLIREAIQSPNFVSGVAGWIIRKDGTAEFASAVFRGLVEVVGSTGAEILIDPQAYPVIQFFSPDGTASAFMRIVTGQAGNKANLEIESGAFTDVDGIPRRFIIQLNENNTAFRFVDIATGNTSGGMVRLLTHSAYYGVEDIVNVDGIYMEFRNDTALGALNIDRTDTTDKTPVPIKNNGTLIPLGVLVNRKSTVAQTPTALGVEVIDTGIGSALPGTSANTTFTAYSGRTYHVSYQARLRSASAVTAGDLRIRTGFDGTATPPAPTAASTQIAGASFELQIAGGGGACQLKAEQVLNCPGDIPVGVHRLGCFYVQTAGPAGNNISVEQSGGQSRELAVVDVGGA